MHLHLQGLDSQLKAGSSPIPKSAVARIDDRHPILTQLDRAFSKQPDASGIIHGVRKVRRGCRGRRTSIFTSVKSDASFLLESGPELDYALLLEHDPAVQSFRTQAIEIELPGEGYAYPDFAIKFETGYEIHEVKASRSSQNRHGLKRFDLMRRQLANCGVGFKVVEADSFPTPEYMCRLNVAYSRGHAIPFTGTDITVASLHLGAQRLENEYAAYKCLADLKFQPGIADFLWFHGRLHYLASDLDQVKEGQA